jgi:hypothetical protein
MRCTAFGNFGLTQFEVQNFFMTHGYPTLVVSVARLKFFGWFESNERYGKLPRKINV